MYHFALWNRRAIARAPEGRQARHSHYVKRFQTPGIEYLKLMDEEFVIVAPSNYEILEFDNLKLEEQWLSEQKWISYGLELPIIRRIWREHFKKRPEIRPIHIIPNLHMILKTVELGVGLSVIPTYLLRNSLKKENQKLFLSI